MYTNINEIVMPNTFFPLQMLKLKTGIAAGVGVLILLGMGIVSIPDGIWYPSAQLIVFSALLFAASPSLEQFGEPFQWIVKNTPYGAIGVAFIIVLFINFIKTLFGGNSNERFVGGSSAIGRTPFKNPNPMCPPTLDFTDPLDSDSERQTPACIADGNALTEEQQLDEIDIYLRDAQESIARMTKYLNVAGANERWLSKKEMDDPNNRDIAKKFKL